MVIHKSTPLTHNAREALISGLSKNYILSAFIIFIFSFLLYAGTLTHQYALDDAIVITENQFTQEGIKGLGGILTKDTFFGFFKEEGKAQLVSGGRYRPLTLVMFALEREAFGSSPFIGHFFNVIWYSITNVLLFIVLLNLLRVRWQESGAMIAFLAAVIFAAHPIHTEVVANIKGRDEITALFFSLTALYFYIKAIDTQKNIYLVAIAPLFFLALMAKENAITFLIVLPLTAWFFRKKIVYNTGLSIVVLVLPALIFLFIRSKVTGAIIAGNTPMELMNNPFLKMEEGRYILMSFSEKYATILYTWGVYLKLLVFPHPLTHDYYPRHIEIMSWENPVVILTSGVYLLGSIWAIKNIPFKNPFAFSILYFLVTFSIVSNLFFPVGTNMSERFVFMPSVGFSLALSFLLYKLSKNYRGFFFILTGIILGLYSFKTIDRNKIWYNNATLFIHDVEISKRSAKLQNAAGGEKIRLATEKEGIKDYNLLQQAIVHLEKAIFIHPTYKNAHLLMGNAHVYLNEYEKGIACYEKALVLDPEYKEGLNNISIAYKRAGQYYGEEKGDIGKALLYLNKAYDLNPDDYDTNRLLGVATGISGNTERALAYFLRAVELNPSSGDAWYNLGSAYGIMGNREEADKAFQKATVLDPKVMERNKR